MAYNLHNLVVFLHNLICLFFHFHFLGTTPGSGACSPPTESEEEASILRARLDAECQQLARDLQAAVRDLVRPELTLGTSLGSKQGMSGSRSGSSRGRAADENHDYSEIYTPSSDEKLGLSIAQPPPPPMHR